MENRWSLRNKNVAERTDRTDLRLCVRSLCVGDLPDDPWVRPAGDSAVQPHTLLLPHSVGAGFNHKLRGVHQAVFVHTLGVFLFIMDLETAEEVTQGNWTFPDHKLLNNNNF